MGAELLVERGSWWNEDRGAIHDNSLATMVGCCIRPFAKSRDNRPCSPFFRSLRHPALLVLFLITGSFLEIAPAEEGLSLRDGDSGPSVYLGDQLITTFHADLKGTPGLYPLLSPEGRPLTRRDPIEPAGEFERQDHPHHRSLWFTFGTVNNIDFWAVKRHRHPVGRVVQTSIDSSTLEGSELVSTTNDWIGPNDNTVLSDRRTFQFNEVDGGVAMRLTVDLTANDEPVTFGDDKEGLLGVRVGGLMKIDAEAGGTAVNAEGLVDGAAWSKASSWVDYSGPTTDLDGSQSDIDNAPVAGITMMYHPVNSLQPCRWHVREYGLFAANPFSREQFGLEGYDGVTIQPGETLSMDFLVLLHDGPLDRTAVEAIYEEYASSKPVEVVNSH